MKLLISIILSGLVAGCATKPTPEQFATADFGEVPTNYKEIVTKKLNLLLKDPESAKIEWLNEPVKAWSWFAQQPGYGYAVCVNLNSKNSYGGYVGYHLSHFLIRNNIVIGYDVSDGGSFSAEHAKRLCKL